MSIFKRILNINSHIDEDEFLDKLNNIERQLNSLEKDLNDLKQAVKLLDILF